MEVLQDAFAGTYAKCHLQPSTEHRCIVALRYEPEPRLYGRGTSLYGPTDLAEYTSRPNLFTLGLCQSSSLVHFIPIMSFLNVEIRRKLVPFGRFLVYLDNLVKQICLGAQIAGGGTLASTDRIFLGRSLLFYATTRFLNIVALAQIRLQSQRCIIRLSLC